MTAADNNHPPPAPAPDSFHPFEKDIAPNQPRCPKPLNWETVPVCLVRGTPSLCWLCSLILSTPELRFVPTAQLSTSARAKTCGVVGLLNSAPNNPCFLPSTIPRPHFRSFSHELRVSNKHLGPLCPPKSDGRKADGYRGFCVLFPAFLGAFSPVKR